MSPKVNQNPGQINPNQGVRTGWTDSGTEQTETDEQREARLAQFSSQDTRKKGIRKDPFVDEHGVAHTPPFNPRGSESDSDHRPITDQNRDGKSDKKVPPPPPPPPPPQSTGNPFFDAAQALLTVVQQIMTGGVGNNNPFFNIAKLLGAKSVIEVAKNEIEVGMTMEVVQDSPMLRHVGLNLDSKAAGLRGLFETWLQYWNQAATAQKQIDKDTQNLATRS